MAQPVGPSRAPRAGAPWAALGALGLAVLLSLVAVFVSIPTSSVSVRIASGPVTEAQVRAVWGGELKAFERTELLVCGSENPRPCVDPPRGRVAVIVDGRYSWARVAKGWLDVPHNEEKYEPNGNDMVLNAFQTSERAGQLAGSAALAARAAVDAQAQALGRSPVLWAVLILASLVAALVLWRRHAARAERRRELWHTLAVGSRHLATVNLDLEATALNEAALRDLKVGGQGPKNLRGALLRLAGRVREKSLELTRREDELYPQLPRALPTAGDLSAEQAGAFRRAAERLDGTDDAVQDGLALLSGGASALDAWDRAARPVIEAPDRLEALAGESAGTARALAPIVERLDALRTKALALRPGTRAETGAKSDEPAHPAAAATSLAALGTLAGEASTLLDEALAPLAALLATDPASAREAARDESWSRDEAPLLSALARGEDAPALSIGGVEAFVQERTAELDTPAGRVQHELASPAAREGLRRRGSRFGCVSLLVPLLALAGIIWGTQAVISAVGERGRVHPVSFADLPQGEGWPTLAQAQSDADEVRAFIPWRISVAVLPADPAQDIVRETTPSKYDSGRRFELLASRDRGQAVRTAIASRPDLVDPATGDLFPDVLLIVVRDVGQGEYRDLGLAWGPTPAPRLSGEYLTGSSESVSVERPRFIPYGAVYYLKQDLAGALGKPAWTESASVRFGLGALVVLAVSGLSLLVLWLIGRRRPERVSRRENDDALEATRARLGGLFTAEDEALLSATAAEARSGDPELEDRRVRVRAQLLALRRLEELASRPRGERAGRPHAADVARASTFVEALREREDELASRARSLLA
ncbi:DUF5129 domain-containing protein [Galactobacter valiniphilus]|uniref:DUF5129 domain-containing protein n=1 Tax=Galactobacter valiniphilus TaxID=2676122 RepID=A0A399JFE9_9MICC|nr:DUF5129 domain-containing protein [Galactobacter valiniphilus]RII42909.1 DUF5129 domain-containing protein [Galactobacter valiniphilus]